MSSWFKATTRRLEQGLLEQLGAATSSKDASFEHDELRFKRLEESLGKVNLHVVSYLASLKRGCDDARELASTLDFYVAADMNHAPAAAHDAAVLDAAQSNLRVHTALKAAVLRSIEIYVTERIISPTGRMMKELPTLRRMLDHRRQKTTDYDAYVRRLDNVRSRPDRSIDELAKAEGKVRTASALLADARATVASTLTRLEEERAALVLQASHVLAGAQVHWHRHAADVLSPLLPLFPEAASTLAELAGLTHVMAAQARPRGYMKSLPTSSMAAGSMAAAMELPRGMDPTRLAERSAASAMAPFAALHAEALGAHGVENVATAAARAAAVKAEAGRMGLLTREWEHAGDASSRSSAVAAARSLSARSDVHVRPVTRDTRTPAAGSAGPSAPTTPGVISRASSMSSLSPATAAVSSGAPSPAVPPSIDASRVTALAARFGGVSRVPSMGQEGAEDERRRSLRTSVTSTPQHSSAVPVPSVASSAAAAAFASTTAAAMHDAAIAVGVKPAGPAGGSRGSGIASPLSTPNRSSVTRRTHSGNVAAFADAAVAPTLDASTVSTEVAAVPLGRIASVRFNFTGASADEINLHTGELVEILERCPDGWWEGRVLRLGNETAAAAPRVATGPVGLFPYNYVDVLPPEESQEILEALRAPDAGGRRGPVTPVQVARTLPTKALSPARVVAAMPPVVAAGAATVSRPVGTPPPAPPGGSASAVKGPKPPAAPVQLPSASALASKRIPTAARRKTPPNGDSAPSEQPGSLLPGGASSSSHVSDSLMDGTPSYIPASSMSLPRGVPSPGHASRDRVSSASASSVGGAPFMGEPTPEFSGHHHMPASASLTGEGGLHGASSDDDSDASSFGGRRVMGLPTETGLFARRAVDMHPAQPELSLTALAAMGALERQPSHPMPGATSSFLEASALSQQDAVHMFEQSWDAERDASDHRFAGVGEAHADVDDDSHSERSPAEVTPSMQPSPAAVPGSSFIASPSVGSMIAMDDTAPRKSGRADSSSNPLQSPSGEDVTSDLPSGTRERSATGNSSTTGAPSAVPVGASKARRPSLVSAARSFVRRGSAAMLFDSAAAAAASAAAALGIGGSKASAPPSAKSSVAPSPVASDSSGSPPTSPMKISLPLQVKSTVEPVGGDASRVSSFAAAKARFAGAHNGGSATSPVHTTPSALTSVAASPVSGSNEMSPYMGRRGSAPIAVKAPVSMTDATSPRMLATGAPARKVGIAGGPQPVSSASARR